MCARLIDLHGLLPSAARQAGLLIECLGCGLFTAATSTNGAQPVVFRYVLEFEALQVENTSAGALVAVLSVADEQLVALRDDAELTEGAIHVDALLVVAEGKTERLFTLLFVFEVARERV